MNLPLPQPPDEMVAAVLEALAEARAELLDAHRIVHMIRAGLDEPEAPVAGARQLIELQVAELRVALWAQTFANIEARASALVGS